MVVPKPEKYNKAEDEKNVRLAAKLDQGLCQWCLFEKEGISKQGSYPHHIFGRRRRWDVNAIITLCYNCHSDVHTARQEDGETVITKGKLIALMEEKVTRARKLRAVRLEIEI
ncbi:MAG: hypothetical protein H8E40_00275 [Chloroflexi bacterium]|nr:hypothetical protein [Chloroflexota bacterium]